MLYCCVNFKKHLDDLRAYGRGSVKALRKTLIDAYEGYCKSNNFPHVRIACFGFALCRGDDVNSVLQAAYEGYIDGIVEREGI